eukprot:2712172-Rhodomonas_salina.1
MGMSHKLMQCNATQRDEFGRDAMQEAVVWSYIKEWNVMFCFAINAVQYAIMIQCYERWAMREVRLKGWEREEAELLCACSTTLYLASP